MSLPMTWASENGDQTKMTNYYKRMQLALALFLSALFSLTAAKAQLAPQFVPSRESTEQPLPKVVFIGDYITYFWANAFAAHPNWINEGSPVVPYLGGDSGTVGELLASFQSDVVSLHPAMVHILIGVSDSDQTHDPTFQLAIPDFLRSLDAVVQEAKAANIKVILGMEPSIFAFAGQLESMNSVIAGYGAANNIPVINYGDALCSCVGSRLIPGQATGIGNDTFDLYGGGPYMAPPATSLPFPYDYPLVVSASGYSMMTQMAETAVATMNLTLLRGWLQNVQQYNDNEDTGPKHNVNTVSPGAVVQFTPVGFYSDGSQHLLLNTSFQGASGTWTSSNPLVIYINQAGLAWANAQGTATIRYTSPTGVSFSEWIMHVGAPFEG
jgi:hypothetical protein